MLFGLFNLKRRFFAVEDRDEDATSSSIDTASSEAGSPRKRLRVQEPASIHETTTPNPQYSCAAEHKEVEKQKKENVEEWRMKLKELEELNVRVKKETEQDVVTIERLKEEAMACMICRDMLQNPQCLQCGHTACYACLRSWWTQPSVQNGHAEVIDTVAESDIDEETPPVPTEIEPAAPTRHRPRRRHRFFSAVNRKKFCPCCNEEVTCRPTPDHKIRGIVETLNTSLAPLPPHIQARREARLTRRPDIWHGIFHPEGTVVVNPETAPVLVLPPPQHPDPILNHIAQAQHRRAAEEAVARRQRVRDQAFADGRRVGMVLETRRLWRRGEEARRVVIVPPLHELRFGGANPPPFAGPGAGAVRDVLLVIPIHQEVIPAPPVAPM